MDSQAVIDIKEQDKPASFTYWNQLKPIAEVELQRFQNDFLKHDKNQLSELGPWQGCKFESGVWGVRNSGTDLFNTTVSMYNLDFFKAPFKLLKENSPYEFGQVLFYGCAIMADRNKRYFLLDDYKVKEISFGQAEAHVEKFGRQLFRHLMNECREVDRKFYDNNVQRII